LAPSRGFSQEFKSTLPSYQLERIQIAEPQNEFRDVLRVTCPRSDCRGRFIVNKRWPRTRPLGTAPCPHCSRVSIIPGGKFAAVQ